MLYISSIKNIYKIYEIYNLINNIKKMDNINEEYCKKIKKKIFSGGCIFIKFAQWLISKLKTESNVNPTIKDFTDYFDDIFEECPSHSLEYTKILFKKIYGIEMEQFININTLVDIASGSVGQVYRAELKFPLWIYEDETYYTYIDLKKKLEIDELDIDAINIRNKIKKIKTVAIKIKHPKINEDVKEKKELFKLLKFIQNNKLLNKWLCLHIDFEDFINNINQQINFYNEKINCDKFRENFKNDKLVYFPKVLYATNDIVISEYIDCIELDDITQYNQLMVCYNFTCIISKMMLIDNFAHLDLHHKNWKIRKIENNKYQIIVFDYGIVYASPDLDMNRKIWDAFETRNIEYIKKILPDIIIGPINNEILKELEEIIIYYSKQTMDLSYIFSKVNLILSKYNCKLSAFTLNLSLTICLIENILKKHNILNNIKPVSNHHLTIRAKQLDIIGYCKTNNIYLDYMDYVKSKIKRNNTLFTHERKNIFCQINDLDLDLPE